MKMPVGKKVEADIQIQPIKTASLNVAIVGESPFIMHRFAFKAWQELLMPAQKKNAAAKSESLKHNPLKEYQECLYLNREDTQPTLFHVPTAMFQEAIASAALDMPGATKSSISRWVSVSGTDGHNQLNVFGVPELYTTMVRSSDMNRTPDVRTRPIFPKWAIAGLRITYKVDPLNETAIFNLLGAAGQIVGCGDWRPQKGGSMGKFRVVTMDDPEFLEILATQGRVAQLQAFHQPTYYDKDTEDINLWFAEELVRRGKSVEPHSLGEGQSLQ
jgi:hypothetical protein